MEHFSQYLNSYVMKKASFILILMDSEGIILDANEFANSITGRALKGERFKNVLIDFPDTFKLEDYLHDEGKGFLLNIDTGGLPETYYFQFKTDGDKVIVIGEQDRMEIADLRKNMMNLNHELGNLSRELQKKNAELNKLNILKNRFLGMAAHDLRSPLAIIETYSDFLIDELPQGIEEEHKEFLDIIKTTSSFMRGLIENLLDVSMIEAGKLELDLVDSDSSQLIEKNVHLNRTIAKRKNIDITFSSAESIPRVSLDENKILQVMNNLISNAVKFSPSDTTVSVTVTADSENLTVSVADEGPGVPEAEREKMFSPFGRTSVRSTGGEKCTGLGLSIVRNIINAHGGEINITDGESKGSVFTFNIPFES